MNLVASLRGVRRVLRACATPMLAVGVVARIAHGGFTPHSQGPIDLALALTCLAAVAKRLLEHAEERRRDNVPRALDARVALGALALMGAIAARTGGTQGALSALPVLGVAVAVALSTPRAAYLLAAFAAAVVAALHHAAHGAADPTALALRVLLVLGAALAHHGLTRVEIVRVREHARQMISDERKKQKEDARSLRLQPTSTAAHARAPQGNEKTDEARVRASLDEIHASIVGLLGLARRTMRLRTCALYWADARGKSLRLVEAATDDAADLHEGPLPIGSGAMGAAMSLGRPVALANIRPDHAGLTYYRGAHGVRCFAAIPVLDEGVARAVLVADRTDDSPFVADDLASLEAVALQARRLIDNERVFSRLERARDDLARLFEASRALGDALTEEQVLDALTTASSAIVAHDLLVVTTYDARGEHRVRHAAGATPRGLAGVVFADNAGIASAAVKARHALPYRGQFDPRSQFVFTRETPLEDMASVMVFPLVVRDAVLGTLTLAAHRRGAFGEGPRQLLGVLAGHASVALSNAAAVRRLEELATTDPMTGHLNKRALEAEFDKRVRAAARFGRPLGVVVLDIDKFKNVNDTYGHAVGDHVIKGLGAVLTRCRRETDAVARFGGEEFVVVCEETDTEGAFQLAERIREELAQHVFQTERGPLQVTCSLGIAEFPRDAADREGLFRKADEALYDAKHNGRNQTRTAAMRAPGYVAPKRPASARKPAVTRKDATSRAHPAPVGGATTTAS